MEYVSLRLESRILRQVEKALKEFNYSTKTEFIREAIRSKLKELKQEKAKEKAWKALFAARGIFKGKGKFESDEDFYKWRKEYSEELAKELQKEYGLKF